MKKHGVCLVPMFPSWVMVLKLSSKVGDLARNRAGGEGWCWYPNAHYKQWKWSQSNDKLLWKGMSPSYNKE